MRINELRKEKGFSQRSLEEAAELQAGTVSDLERGKNKNPSWIIVWKISRVFDTRPENVFPPEDFPGMELKR